MLKAMEFHNKKMAEQTEKEQIQLNRKIADVSLIQNGKLRVLFNP